jgi:hypothetical protein
MLKADLEVLILCPAQSCVSSYEMDRPYTVEEAVKLQFVCQSLTLGKTYLLVH